MNQFVRDVASYSTAHSTRNNQKFDMSAKTLYYSTTHSASSNQRQSSAMTLKYGLIMGDHALLEVNTR